MPYKAIISKRPYKDKTKLYLYDALGTHLNLAYSQCKIYWTMSITIETWERNKQKKNTEWNAKMNSPDPEIREIGTDEASLVLIWSLSRNVLAESIRRTTIISIYPRVMLKVGLLESRSWEIDHFPRNS